MAPPPPAPPVPALSKAREMIREIMHSWGQTGPHQPLIAAPAVRDLRIALIREEHAELQTALRNGDLVGIADGCADLMVVVLGTMVAYGLPADIFDEVHRSNLSKLGEDGKPIKNELGKTLKGPNYEPPKLKKLLREFGAYIPD